VISRDLSKHPLECSELPLLQTLLRVKLPLSRQRRKLRRTSKKIVFSRGKDLHLHFRASEETKVVDAVDEEKET
jgi:hypothetical protein